MRSKNAHSRPLALRLQPSPLESVEVKRVVLIGLVVALPAYVAGSLLTPRPVFPSYSDAHSRPTAHGREDDGRTDAYGNDVSSAVAEYSLDESGDVYEQHSPQTEMPHLASPKS